MRPEARSPATSNAGVNNEWRCTSTVPMRLRGSIGMNLLVLIFDPYSSGCYEQLVWGRNGHSA